MLKDGDTWMDGLAPFLRNTLSSDEIEPETYTHNVESYFNRGTKEDLDGEEDGRLLVETVLRS